MFLPPIVSSEPLEAEDWQSIEGSEKLIRYYLENPTINASSGNG